jgi:hypothetical protein
MYGPAGGLYEVISVRCDRLAWYATAQAGEVPAHDVEERLVGFKVTGGNPFDKGDQAIDENALVDDRRRRQGASFWKFAGGGDSPKRASAFVNIEGEDGAGLVAIQRKAYRALDLKFCVLQRKPLVGDEGALVWRLSDQG